MAGINKLSDLKGNCFINDDGCWIWKGGYSQKGYLPVAHLGDQTRAAFGMTRNQRTMSAYRAAWLLSGKSIPEGYVVYRHVCLNNQCANPAHCKTGTKAEMHTRYSESGKNKGQPNRIIANMKNRAKLFCSPEKVASIEASLAEGMTVKAIIKLHRTDGGTVRKIRAGVHPSQAQAPLVHANSSIFALGRLAA